MFSKRLLNSVLLNKKFHLNKCHKRFGYFQPYRKGDYKYEKIIEDQWEAETEWEKLTSGLKIMKDELKLWSNEMRNNLSFDADFDTFANKEVVKLWDFDQRNNDIISSHSNHSNQIESNDCNDMKTWITACDSDYDEGYSRCDWTVSPTGRALFSGHLDTRVPQTGNQVKAGYAFVGCEKARRSFYRQAYFRWETFTHLLVRCRGDGRPWFIILNVSDDRADITWFDRYQYTLYTHGGPYWQWCKIPFSRFYLQHKGYAQDRQHPVPMAHISQLGFLLADSNTGAFNLEIDYVGAMRDDDWTEETMYEHYYHKENPVKFPQHF